VINAPNKILSLLSSEDAALLAPHLETIELQRDQVLFEPLAPIEYVYFFKGGLSSEVALNPDGNSIEVACVGYEGFSGVPVVLGLESSPHKSFMQAGGQGLRIRSEDLRGAMASSASLSALLLRYVHVFMIQIAASALADGRYQVEQRLARWLLMCNDRLGAELPLTHDFLSLMLGVRRPSVTDALHVLEGQRLIYAERSLIKIRNRRGLEEAAGSAYGMPEQEYRRVITNTWPVAAIDAV
jgi:CRP-like cAMP-binding protein